MTREDAISIMNVIVHMLEPQYDTDRIEDAVEMAIEALELVTSYEGTINKLTEALNQQKEGHWILADEQNKEDVENDNYRFICSECKCSDIHAKSTIVPYCWKCGAKMKGGD